MGSVDQVLLEKPNHKQVVKQGWSLASRPYFCAHKNREIVIGSKSNLGKLRKFILSFASSTGYSHLLTYTTLADRNES